jgi:hypothetical protein
MNASALFHRLRSPAAILLIVIIAAADIFGVIHAFRVHGTMDGTIATVLPPYGLYRAGEAFRKHAPRDAAQVAETAAGRNELAETFALRPEVWNQLLVEIGRQRGAKYSTTMNEAGLTFDIVGAVNTEGAVLSIRGRSAGDASIDMIDADKDQHPETIRVAQMGANGKATATQSVAIESIGDEDRSQFLLGWTLAWGQIAGEFKQAADAEYGNTNSNLTITPEPLE